jgi:ABC-type lipoprotein export system ATPase subunit
VRELTVSIAQGGFHLLDAGHELALRLLGLLDTPDAGKVFVADTPASELPEDSRAQFRDRHLGFVFTAPFLLPAFTAIENVAMPLFKLSEVDAAEARRRSERLLEFVGLLEVAQSPCSELTELEQHCVALARALINEPLAILVESLDGTLADEELSAFSALLRQAAQRFGISVVATVTPHFRAEPGDHVIAIADGRLQADSQLLAEPGA